MSAGLNGPGLINFAGPQARPGFKMSGPGRALNIGPVQRSSVYEHVALCR